MYELRDIADIIEQAGEGTIGMDLFLYHSPADVSQCTLLYPSNDPPLIDPERPGYLVGKFQVIRRDINHTSGFEKCRAISDALTLYETETQNIKIKQLRPLYQARAYRRSDNGILEFSITFKINYIQK
jgi:hypothetical protein